MERGNVFGIPVTEGNRFERALMAYNDPNAYGKRDDAVSFVIKEKERYGKGCSILGIFYNATGDDLMYERDHSVFGKIYDLYPVRVMNGQWGAFVQVNKNDMSPKCMGFVMYRGHNDDIDYCNQLLGWGTHLDQISQHNHAYCDIYDIRFVPSVDVILEKIEHADHIHVVRKKNMYTTSKVEQTSSSLYEAILTIENLVTNKNIVVAEAGNSSA